MVAARPDAGESLRDEPTGWDRCLIDEPTRQQPQFCWGATFGGPHRDILDQMIGDTNEFRDTVGVTNVWSAPTRRP
jgi:hypothetical protein